MSVTTGCGRCIAACADLCQKASRFPNTRITDNAGRGLKMTGDLWHDSEPNSVWKVTLSHAEKLGLGTQNYTLVRV